MHAEGNTREFRMNAKDSREFRIAIKMKLQDHFLQAEKCSHSELFRNFCHSKFSNENMNRRNHAGGEFPISSS